MIVKLRNYFTLRFVRPLLYTFITIQNSKNVKYQFPRRLCINYFILVRTTYGFMGRNMSSK